MEPKVSFILFFFLMIPGSFSTTFTLRNSCPYTVWQGILTNPNLPQFLISGFELAARASQSSNASAGWGGRFWARTECNGQFTCATGTCAPSLACNGARGATPVTLAEVTLNGDGGKDFYDISLVDGFNIPVGIRPDRGCPSTTCSANINSVCPANLSVKGSDGRTIACKTACLAFNQPQYYCTGEYNNPDRCRATDYSRIFKNACTQTYSYPYDGAASPFTWATGANYVITFCP